MRAKPSSGSGAGYRSWLLAIMLVALVAGLDPAVAADRALLVGVGEYRNPALHLPGVGRDLQAMEVVADLMGFDQVRVLRDGEATAEGVKQALRDWIAGPVGADDRVLIYFSTHGIRVADRDGDETEDGADEALVLYDFAVRTAADGSPRADGILLDDEFNGLLANIRARSILAIIDACHSGSIHRALNPGHNRARAMGLHSKFLPTPAGLSYRGGLPARSSTLPRSPLVVLTAARDDEESYASEQGSVFTLGIARAVVRAAQSARPLTAAGLWAAAGGYVHDRLGPGLRSTPQISAPGWLAGSRLVLRLEGRQTISPQAVRVLARAEGFRLPLGSVIE